MSRFSMSSVVVLTLAVVHEALAEEVLTLDDAVAAALQNSRAIQNATLQVESDEENVGAARTRRLPSFDLQVRAAQLVTPVSMEFPAGAFGDYPGIGAIPSVDGFTILASSIRFHAPSARATAPQSPADRRASRIPTARPPLRLPGSPRSRRGLRRAL